MSQLGLRRVNFQLQILHSDRPQQPLLPGQQNIGGCDQWVGYWVLRIQRWNIMNAQMQREIINEKCLFSDYLLN